MGNPITDLTQWASSTWDRARQEIVAPWHQIYDLFEFPPWRDAVNSMLTGLSHAIEKVAVLAGTSDLDTIEIVRDTAWGTIENFRHLAWPVLPRWGGLAAMWADGIALARALAAERYALGLVDREHAEMEQRVLQEELARLVEVADVWARLHTEIAIERNDRIVAVDQLRAQLAALIAKTRADLLAFIDQVRAQLAAQIAQLAAYAHSLPGLVDQEAASGYDPTLRARAGTLQRLIDTLAAHDPLIAGLVRDLATFLIDLAEIDNPVLRLAAQFVLRQVIDHLAVDTALRDLADKLLGGILGSGPPKTLAEVTAAAGSRLNAVEQSISALSPLAGEADNLHEMGTLTFDAALLAYLTTGVTDPRAWADDTQAVLHVTVDPLLQPVLRLLGAP